MLMELPGVPTKQLTLLELLIRWGGRQGTALLALLLYRPIVHGVMGC